MSPSLGPLSGRGGTLWRRGERTHSSLGTVALVLLVVLGSAGFVALLAPAPGASRDAPTSLAPSVTTHGDLVVPSGSTVTIGPSSGTATYYQGGNITVEAGGTLLVQNSVLSFVQFVAAGASTGNAFSHLYRFVDQGTVTFSHASLTTSVALPNASAKLFVSVSGTLNVVNSTFAFPGWINVVGSGAVATFNDSLVEGNPDVASVLEPTVIQADTLASPVLNVSGGAELNLFGSGYLGLNQDDLGAYGVPSPQNLTLVGTAPIVAGGANLTASNFTLLGATSSQLVQDMLYPSEATSVTIVVAYSNGAASTVTSAVSVFYDGSAYPVGTASFASGGGTTTLVAPSSSLLVQSMYQDGTPFFASAGVDFAAPSAPGVTVTGMALNLTPAVNYNLTASGAGTRFNAVDSTIGVNFNPTLTNGSSSTPWASNKLVVDAGATAFLANLTVTSAIPELFSSSAVLTSAGGVAYVYRWAQANLTGGPNSAIGMYGAAMTAFYAFDSNQVNNATANSLNDLAAASPAIWGYVQYVDGTQGRPGYGVSGPGGAASLLLASSEITSASLPDGTYLGDYHLGVTAPLTPSVTSWVMGSVSPYPQGTAAKTAGYGMPDYVSHLNFPQYSVNASVGSITVSANAVVATTVHEGEVLGVNVTFTNVGEAPVYALSGSLYWNTSHTGTPLDQVSLGGLALANNESVSVVFTWVVNDSITGLHGSFTHSFSGLITWFGDPNGSYQGTVPFVANVTVAPSPIVITLASAPPSSVSLTQFYYTTGVVAYNGSYPATIEVYATAGGTSHLIGSQTSMPGPFSVSWVGLSSVLSAGTTYTVTVVARYNGATSASYTAGQFSTPATTTTSKNFLEQTYFGLPLWLYLAIAAAIVVGVVAFLLFARRTAAGKLVECGECGNLIPEEATVCPKCGAEFEADLIRCSRCASTIPANSKVCPECAAQLLGKPGEAEDDPERQGYADFTERFRAEAKKELGDNYTEGAFWDWWKRQPTYTSFGQWKLQQGQGTSRTGMVAPPAGAESAAPRPGTARPPSGGAAATPPAPLASPARTAATAAPPPAPAASSVPATGVHACPNCGKEIPAEYLVCPFCGAVTQ